jgi:hypothetical protein
MNRRHFAVTGILAIALAGAAASPAGAQAGAETFTATAMVKTAAAATATAPVTIVVTRKMSSSEAGALTGALTTGGAAALRKALVGVPETGSVQLGATAPTPTRLTLERTTPTGRLLTIVADKPILSMGAGLPGAKPREGYDFAVIDIEVDARGSGSGTLAGAAKVTVKQGAFVVEDYAAEAIRLTNVTKVK